VEYTDVAEKYGVHLKGLQFNAIFSRRVFYCYRGEIRQPGFRADTGKLRDIQDYGIIFIGVLILPNLDLRRLEAPDIFL
jgi:hypothetical protein